MALSRKYLKGMGLSDEQVDSIIEAHLETVNGLKADLDKCRPDAEKLPQLQKEIDDLKARGSDGWEDKYNKVKKEFDDYKSDIQSKEAKAAKERAVRAYYEGKNITGKSLDIAMRGSAAEIDAVELDGGKIRDTRALDDLVGGTFAGLVTKETAVGARTDTPPANSGGSATKAEIMRIKDAGERQKAIAENHELFGF